MPCYVVKVHTSLTISLCKLWTDLNFTDTFPIPILRNTKDNIFNCCSNVLTSHLFSIFICHIYTSPITAHSKYTWVKLCNLWGLHNSVLVKGNLSFKQTHTGIHTVYIMDKGEKKIKGWGKVEKFLAYCSELPSRIKQLNRYSPLETILCAMSNACLKWCWHALTSECVDQSS